MPTTMAPTDDAMCYAWKFYHLVKEFKFVCMYFHFKVYQSMIVC